MNPTQIEFDQNSSAAEKTLRILAVLPAPEGLEQRVKAGLRAASQSGRVLRWPSAGEGGGWMHGKAVRAAAAAAIVFVVAGGGWGVYSRVKPPEQPKVIAMPQRVVGTGGFSSANAIRTPQTLDGPVLTHQVTQLPKADDGGAKVVPMPTKPHRRRATQSEKAPIQSIAR
jgi:hypothetical protein